MRNFDNPVNFTHLIESVEAWRQTSMQAENLLLNDGAEREVVEEVGQVLPDVRVTILPKTFVIKTINLGDLSTLMVTSKDANSVLESYL